MVGRLLLLLPMGWVRLRRVSGRRPLARRTESRIVARPKEGERWRVAERGFSWGIGGVGREGIRGMAGNWAGRRPDWARKERAFIQSSWRVCETVVNFSALWGVRMRIERLNAVLSSAPLGKGVLSWTSRTDWIVTAIC